MLDIGGNSQTEDTGGGGGQKSDAAKTPSNSAASMSSKKRPPLPVFLRKRLFENTEDSALFGKEAFEQNPKMVERKKEIVEEISEVIEELEEGDSAKQDALFALIHTSSKAKAEEALKTIATGGNEELVELVQELKDFGNGETPRIVPPLQIPDTQQQSSESELVASIVADLNDILCRACQPALTFIGKVAVKLRENDVRNLLVWNDNPKASMDDRLKFVKTAPTIREFIEANRELGSEFLTSYLETRLSKEYVPPPPPPQAVGEAGGESVLKRLKIDAQLQTPFNLDIYEQQYDQTNRLRFIEEQRNKIRNQLQFNPADTAALQQTEAILAGLITLSISEVELKFAPAWAFESLSNSIFRHIWSTTSLAAVEAAAQAVRRIEGCSSFTIKELISSEQVSDQFAFLVSASYLNSGDGIPQAQGRGGRGGNRQSTYLNVLRMREMLASKIYTCNIWFESVRKRPNPLVAQFKQQVAMVLAQLPDGDEKRNRVAKFAKLEASLPKWELVYSGY